jgi:hypothetical protein
MLLAVATTFKWFVHNAAVDHEVGVELLVDPQREERHPAATAARCNRQRTARFSG